MVTIFTGPDQDITLLFGYPEKNYKLDPSDFVFVPPPSKKYMKYIGNVKLCKALIEVKIGPDMSK